MRRITGIVERFILGAVMGVMLSLIERLLTSERDLRRAQRLLRRLKGGV